MPSSKATNVKKPTKKRKNKKSNSLKWILGIIFVIVVSFILYLFSTVTSPKIVYIPQGSVFKSIAHLQNEGVNVYRVDALILRSLGSPQQGWIDLKAEKHSRIVFLYRLTKAKAATETVILIPGETTELFLENIAKELDMDKDKLKEAYTKNADYPEGMLVPDTYSIPKLISEEKLIQHLLQQSKQKHVKLSEKLIGEYDEEKWLHLVTLASIIQKEAASVEDMPLVSSVIQNRLKKGMRLQMDGTLNYGKYSHQKVTASRIRNDKTPYNTYKYKGIPEFPVCNVSTEALQAAAHPKQTEYLYFVRGKNGKHIYSSYFSTHRKNIQNATK